MTELKLYIWTDFSPDYDGGLAIAIAESEQEAQEMIEGKLEVKVEEWGDLEIRQLSHLTKFACYVNGEVKEKIEK